MSINYSKVIKTGFEKINQENSQRINSYDISGLTHLDYVSNFNKGTSGVVENSRQHQLLLDHWIESFSKGITKDQREINALKKGIHDLHGTPLLFDRDVSADYIFTKDFLTRKISSRFKSKKRAMDLLTKFSFNVLTGLHSAMIQNQPLDMKNHDVHMVVNSLVILQNLTNKAIMGLK